MKNNQFNSLSTKSSVDFKKGLKSVEIVTLVTTTPSDDGLSIIRLPALSFLTATTGRRQNSRRNDFRESWPPPSARAPRHDDDSLLSTSRQSLKLYPKDDPFCNEVRWSSDTSYNYTPLSSPPSASVQVHGCQSPITPIQQQQYEWTGRLHVSPWQVVREALPRGCSSQSYIIMSITANFR